MSGSWYATNIRWSYISEPFSEYLILRIMPELKKYKVTALEKPHVQAVSAVLKVQANEVSSQLSSPVSNCSAPVIS